MTFVQASRIVQARTISAPSTARILHSSAQANRGVAIGGVGRSRPVESSGIFASLREQAQGGSEPAKETHVAAQNSYEARQAAIQHDVQATASKEAQVTSSQQAGAAVKQNSVAAPASPPSHTPSTSFEARKSAIKADKQPPSSSSPGWKELGQRIESERRQSASSKHTKAASQPAPKQNATNSIESLPHWALSRYALQRSFPFTNPVRARMFLQGASSQLLLETGWAGSIGLSRSSSGAESVDISLSGSQETGVADMQGEASVTEEDVAIAGALDELCKSSSLSQERKARSVAFSPAETPTYSVLHQETSAHSPIDSHVPVHIPRQARNVGELVEDTPTNQVLSATGSRYSSTPIEEHVPVPNLHQQSKREFATLMGRSTPPHSASSSASSQPLGIARIGLAGIIAARSSGLNGISSSALERRRLVATWTGQANVTASQQLWSGLVAQESRSRRVKVDDFVPVHIDGAQMGKRRVQ